MALRTHDLLAVGLAILSLNIVAYLEAVVLGLRDATYKTVIGFRLRGSLGWSGSSSKRLHLLGLLVIERRELILGFAIHP